MLNILAIGASRNIGYHASLRFLDAGHKVTYLLRSPTAFDADDLVQSHLAKGLARVVKGDALNRDDIKLAWDAAQEHGGPVDVLLFSVGFTGAPSFHILKGFTMNPPNLVTQSMLNTLSTMPSPSHTKVVVVSAMGSTQSSYASLPLLLRLFHGYFLKAALTDKAGTERVLAHCSGSSWDPTVDGPEPSTEIMGTDGWKELEGLPTSGSLKNVLVVKPTLLTDGDCRFEAQSDSKPLYKVNDGPIPSAWNISRKDVAYFIVDAVCNGWEEFAGKRVNISY